MLDADKPIGKKQQDRLDRRSFVEEIAREICASPQDGFTIAVKGRWGSGKTSVLNMVEEEVSGEWNIAVVHFNPWYFRGAGDLLTRFVDELSKQLGLNKLDSVKQVAGVFAKVMPHLGSDISIPGVSVSLKLFGWIIAKAVESPSLYRQYMELAEALENCQVRVVVFIDDIDRLQHEEIREMLRLVRLISELPNMVLVVAFDEQYVARSLARSLGERSETVGRRYLEKLFQSKHDIPAIQEFVLDAMVDDGIERIRRDFADLPMDQAEWRKCRRQIIKPLITNVRDLKRYLNTIPGAISRVGDEVALADLLSLEALRILRPQIFEELKANAHLLVHSNFMAMQSNKDDVRKQLTAMLGRGESERGPLKDVLSILFPATDEYVGMGGAHGSNWDKVWLRERRVACEMVLHIYLEGGLGSGRVSSVPIRKLVDARADEGVFQRLVDEVVDEDLDAVCLRIVGHAKQFRPEEVKVVAPILANAVGRKGELSRDDGVAPAHANWIFGCIEELLETVEGSRRFELINEILPAINNLSGRFWLIWHVGPRKDGGNGLVAEDQARELEIRFVRELKHATVQELSCEWGLATLVINICGWVIDEDLSHVLSRHLDRDEFVWSLIRTAHYSYPSNEGQKKHIHWKELQGVFGEGLIRAVDKLKRSEMYRELTEDDQDTVNFACRMGKQ